MAYTFNDGSKPVTSRNSNRRRRETSSPSTSTYTFENSSAMLQTASEFNDGHSLTYSASSSQAGESTDSSSIADLEFIRMVERENSQHQDHFIRQSNSLGYSTDEPDSSFHEDRGRNSNSGRHGHHHQQYTSRQQPNRINSRGPSTSGQRSSSNGNDGGYNHNMHRAEISKTKCRSTPNHHRKTSSSDFNSPTTVSADISNGSAHTPPPRHVKRLSADGNNELWYQKWWMCGFTDAFS